MIDCYGADVDQVLSGDVFQLRDGRWCLVLTASQFAVTDNRRIADRPPAPRSGVAERPNPHVKIYRPGQGWS